MTVPINPSNNQRDIVPLPNYLEGPMSQKLRIVLERWKCQVQYQPLKVYQKMQIQQQVLLGAQNNEVEKRLENSAPWLLSNTPSGMSRREFVQQRLLKQHIKEWKGLLTHQYVQEMLPAPGDSWVAKAVQLHHSGQPIEAKW